MVFFFPGTLRKRVEVVAVKQTADRLAQLVECRTTVRTVREVVGSSPGRTITQGL